MTKQRECLWDSLTTFYTKTPSNNSKNVKVNEFKFSIHSAVLFFQRGQLEQVKLRQDY